jgi:hypothetical protein
MSGALQLLGEALPARRAGRLAPTARLRSGAAVQTAAGRVSAFFALEGFDRRRGVATYALRVINRTKSALICRTWVLCNSGEAVLAYPAFFEVEPFSTSETLVPLWPRDFAPFDRAVAEVVGNGVHCIVEAAAPPVRNLVRTYWTITAVCLAAGVLALAAAAGLRQAMPRIAALAVPPEALAGTTVQAEYSAFGSGRLSYLVIAPDGRRLQGGRLDDRSGAIFISLPPANQPGAYTLRMAMDGPLGSASETRILNTLSSKQQAAQIDDISVNPVVAKPGQSVDVAYSAAADGGYVRLVGSDGSIWAQEPFSRTGETRLMIPPVPDAREMRVVLHVTKGKSTAESMAGILVTNALNPARPGWAAVGGKDDPGLDAVTGSDANGAFEVTERTVRSGNPISVRILSPRNGMRIALTDAQSHEVAGTDVGADADVVTLRAPTVSVPTQYTVVATFTDGFGQESIVQPVTILP